MDLSVPDTVDNRYKVLEVIGTGAMATVYAAEDTRLGRKVALKICLLYTSHPHWRGSRDLQCS